MAETHKPKQIDYFGHMQCHTIHYAVSPLSAMHSYDVLKQNIAITLYQCLYFDYVTLCMILLGPKRIAAHGAPLGRLAQQEASCRPAHAQYRHEHKNWFKTS